MTPPLATWQPGPANPSLPHRELHVWRIPLAATAQTLDAARALLAPDERVRADRFTVDAPRRRFTFARAALRNVLARYTGQPPREIAFTTGPHGKPALAGDSPFRFNLSHSEDLALLAVTRRTDVGIDLEAIDPRRAADDIAARYFSPAEQAQLGPHADPAARTAAFFRAWSRKEAVIKALGEGLACPLTSFDVSLDPLDARLLALRREHTDPSAWTMLAIEAAPGYAAAAAVIGPCDHAAGFAFA
jgi:4'-phosphopantetheinyl transferase